MEKKKKRYGLLLCADDSEYVKKKYGGYFSVFVDLLCSDNRDEETWELYRVGRGEFPTEEDLSTHDGFVVSGSCCDAHSDEPWIRRLLSLLKTLISMNKKLLGICFGHQILCRALGGKTGRNVRGWDIGVTTVNFLHSANKLASLNVIQCHRDEILELPAGTEVVARSEKTKVEIFKYRDHVMGIQGHPEYNQDIVLHIVNRLLDHHKLIQISHANAARDSFNRPEPNKEAWKKLCRTFLNGSESTANCT